MASRMFSRSAGMSMSLRPSGPVMQLRSYAKKAKKHGGSAAAAASSDGDNAADFVRTFDQTKLQERMDGTLAHMKEQFSTMRIGRANPAILDNVRVRLDNSSFTLRDLAQVTIRDPQTLLVSVHDPEFRAAVDKSIRESGLNLNPIIDNEVIRIPIPKATKETRDKMSKVVTQMSEQMKAKIRIIRQDGMKQLKHDSKHASADEIKKFEKLVQTMTEKHNKAIEDLIKTKVKEIQS